MPPLGMASLKDLSNIVKETLQIEEKEEGSFVTEYLESYKAALSWAPKCTEYQPFNLEGWVPDSKDLNSAIIKTIIWYNANQWIFKW